MDINIQAVVDEKIRAMHESGQIRERIEKGVEESIIKAIDSAVSGYEIRRDIEKQMAASVSAVVNDIGFSAYNGFIASTVRKITEEILREDVAEKIQKVFSDLLIARHDGIKLSEIFAAYRKWVCEDTDEPEKYARQLFTCDLEDQRDGNFIHYRVRFHDEEISRRDTAQIEFSICTYGKLETGTLSWLRIDGSLIDGTLRLGHLTDIQALLANLYFNKTEIVLDTENVDDDNGFDIDI